MKTLKNTYLVLLTTLTLWNCAPLYDHYTYTETIETKVATISLMERGDTPYAENMDRITDLKNQMRKMIIYEEGKKKNQVTTQMWKLLSSDQHLVGSYLTLWEKKGQLNSAFIPEATAQVEEAFDKMLSYESKKDKQSKNALLSFIENL